MISAPARSPAFIGISHGTASPVGQAAVQQLFDDVIARLTSTDVASPTPRLGHVDVQTPSASDLTASLSAQQPAVIVPLLLSAGYHVHKELSEAAETAESAVNIAPVLGPDDRLVSVLLQRLAEVEFSPREDIVILGAAGSSLPATVTACQEMAARLSRTLGQHVRAGFVSHAQPSIAKLIAEARRHSPGRRIVVSSYLLAPGYFHTQLKLTGADIVTEPLLAAGQATAPPQLVNLVVERYRAAA